MADYTIDKLAQKAHTTVRNVRSYQDKGLLPPPRREGRSGMYSDIHLARLRLIGQLLSRGYTTANIGELLGAWEKGQDVAQLIGLENAITTPFRTEVPTYITLEELYEMFGASADQKALELSLRLGVLELEGDRIKVVSPQLLQAGAELAKSGLPLHELLVQVNALRGDVERIATRFVQLIVDQVFNKYGEDQLPPRAEVPRLAELVRRLRPMAQTVVDVELARALENVSSAALSDRIARFASTIPDKRRKGKRKPARR